MTDVVAVAQAPAAHALASAYAHHWSILSPEEVIGKTSEEIFALSCGREEPGIGCRNAAPVLDEGDVEHTTASGRLFWRVEASGAITLRVFRPAKPGDDRAEDSGLRVVNIFLPADLDPKTAEDYCYTEEYAFLPRHIAAAREAVQALVPVNPNAQTVLEWLSAQEESAQANADGELKGQLDAVYTADQGQVVQAIEVLVKRVRSDAYENSQAAFQLRSELLRLTAELAALI